MGKVKSGLIGYGYWGPNLARTISQSENSELKYCAEIDEKLLSQAKKDYPQIITIKNYSEMLSDDEISAIFIVTPTKTHHKIAKDCLKASKHVFIEKPIASSTDEVKELITLANKHRVKLMVGHIFLFNPAVQYIKKTIKKGIIGKTRYLHFQRRNLGPIRKDVNVLWDLAPHDISMALYFVDKKPVRVLAVGQSFLQKGIQDVVISRIHFEGNILANMIFSWIDPIKIRDITIVGEKKMILFNDIKPVQKIKIFDKNAKIIENTRGVSFNQYQILIHSGSISVPKIERKEPLAAEISHFIDCITKNLDPITDGRNGLEVVKIISALQESLENGSKVVNL